MISDPFNRGMVRRGDVYKMENSERAMMNKISTISTTSTILLAN